MSDTPITLTDSTEVVDLKKEFGALDAKEEAYKEELAAIRERKAAITRRIFHSTLNTDGTQP